MRRLSVKIRSSLSHWLITCVLIVASIYLGKFLGEKSAWISWRYNLYQRLQSLSARAAEPKWTTLVLVDDQEYWKGELARRVPIKRNYLAKLIKAIGSAGPIVVAIDFDLRAASPDGSVIDHVDYVTETNELIMAIHDVTSSCKVVLPRTLGFDERVGYVAEPAVYDVAKFEEGVEWGYIELFDDLRQVPQAVELGNKQEIDSFSLAIAKAVNKNVSSRQDTVPFGTFVEEDGFDEKYTSGQVLQMSKEELQATFGHRAVIVGAGWHRLAYGRGETVDSYDTPIGRVGGVYLHANYVEAMLDARTYPPLSHTAATLLEVVFASAVAILFALHVRGVVKLLGFFSICLLLLFATYIFWQNLGLFFDFFIPLFILAGHAVYEQVREWQEVASKCVRHHHCD